VVPCAVGRVILDELLAGGSESASSTTGCESTKSVCPPEIARRVFFVGQDEEIPVRMFPGRFVIFGQVLQAIAAAAAGRRARGRCGAATDISRLSAAAARWHREVAAPAPPLPAVNRREDVDAGRPSSRSGIVWSSPPNCVSRRTMRCENAWPSPGSPEIGL